MDEPAAYHAEGILYLPAEARFDYLLQPARGRGHRRARSTTAMRDIEKHNPQLAGVLPKTYNLFTSTLLKELLKKVSEIPASVDYDAFGRIYEYFLGEFARTEGQKGGEFYTPSCIVRLLTEVIEPYHGRILDPACGSGGMFVSVRAIRRGAQEESRRRTLHPRRREDRRNRPPLPPEPRRPWILEPSATGLCKPDLHVFAKLFEDCLKRGLEAQAFSGREIGGHDDVLDFLVGHFVDVDLTRQPAS